MFVDSMLKPPVMCPQVEQYQYEQLMEMDPWL